MTSGQLFRWSRLPDGSWLGADGDFWYHALRLRTLAPALRSELASVDSPEQTRGFATGRRHEPSVGYRVVGEQGWAAKSRESGEPGWSVESNAAPADFARLFRLEPGWAGVEAELLRLGPELAPLMEALPGLRLTRPSDPTETLFSFLCTSNNHVARITAMVAHLSSYGPALAEVQGRTIHRFPSIARLAEVSETELRAHGFGYRAATIPLAAKELSARGGEGYLAALATRRVEDIRRELLGLPGVGPKLADCITLFALHKTESVPIDTHIWQAVTRLYFPEWREASLTGGRYAAAASFVRSRFGNLAGWAQQYLFYDNLLNWRGRREG